MLEELKIEVLDFDKSPLRFGSCQLCPETLAFKPKIYKSPGIYRSMKVAVLYSGGKDSNYAVEYALKKGWEIKYLLSVKPTRTDCYLFHFATVEHTPMQAEALGLKHILVRCSVADPVQEALVVREVVEGNRVDAVLLGGTGLQQTQIKSIQNALLPLGIEVFAAHAGEDHDLVVKTLIAKGYDIRISQIATEGLSEKWLGRQIDKDSFAELQKLSQQFGFHIGGEGGYYDTFVCDGPMFRKRIIIEDAENFMEGRYSGHMIAKRLRLVDKRMKVDI